MAAIYAGESERHYGVTLVRVFTVCDVKHHT